MKDLPLPWKFGVIDCDFETMKVRTTEKPFSYNKYRYPSIYAANGNEVVGCDEYYIFYSPEVARLLTAAPDLLYALQKMCEAVEGEYGEIAKSLAWDMAQNAINKALGETQ